MISVLAWDTAAAFVLFWNLCQSWLPDKIIHDIDNFIAVHGLPSMDPTAISLAQDGAYTIVIGDMNFVFHVACLAPPMGVMASNYAQ